MSEQLTSHSVSYEYNDVLFNGPFDKAIPEVLYYLRHKNRVELKEPADVNVTETAIEGNVISVTYYVDDSLFMDYKTISYVEVKCKGKLIKNADGTTLIELEKVQETPFVIPDNIYLSCQNEVIRQLQRSVPLDDIKAIVHMDSALAADFRDMLRCYNEKFSPESRLDTLEREMFLDMVVRFLLSDPDATWTINGDSFECKEKLFNAMQSNAEERGWQQL